MNTIVTINPSTEEEIKSYDLLSDEQVAKRIVKSQTTYVEWRKTPFSHRSLLLNQAADILEQNANLYARTISIEMGKTLSSSIAEVKKCAWVCRFYADNAASFLADEYVTTDASKSYISYQPLGIILAVMPWNFPFWQVFRFAAPTIMAGNVALLKHASNVPECALIIEEVFRKAGFPEHTFSSLIVGSSQVEKIIENSRVKGVSLTGSEVAGKAVAEIAGRNIKQSLLELGGSDAYILFPDADVDHAVENCAQSRLLNTGQSCIGAKRFIVHADIYDEFVAKLKVRMYQERFGDPFDEKVNMGPMARIDLRDELHNQVVSSIKAGAKCILGGEIPIRKGAFYPPTILVNVQKGMPAYSEELFGPVASVIKVNDEKQAIQVANDTSFGLGSCLFTQDLVKAERIAKYDLEAGSCFVNQFVKSDPRLPFGGIGISGYGRELSKHGIKAFTNVKTIYIA